jgi:hypothetical protein
VERRFISLFAQSERLMSLCDDGLVTWIPRYSLEWRCGAGWKTEMGRQESASAGLVEAQRCVVRKSKLD